MRTISLLSVCLAMLIATAGCDLKWTYYGPHGLEDWAEEFKSCNGTRQSPIDIDIANHPAGEAFSDIMYINYESIPTDYILENNGETVVMSAEKKDPEVDIVLGNRNIYKFLQLHFHWGSDNDRGSEHTINGKHFPMEMHIVHIDARHLDPLEEGDGLAVLSVLFEIGKHDKNFQHIIDALKYVQHYKNMTKVKPFPLGSLLPKQKNVLRYMGSLTTPPCFEVVVWSVYRQHVTISEEQIEQFRKLKDSFENPMVDNFRPTQKLNGRSVTFSKYDPNGSNSLLDNFHLGLLMPVLYVFK